MMLLLTATPLRAEDCAAPLAAAEAYRTAAIDAARGRAPLRRDYPDCPPLGAAVTEWRDAEGVLRRASLRSGGEDSAFTAETYFDAQGRPRFAYVSGGAVSGARLTQRIAIGADGRRICEARRVTVPVYPFPNPWPDALLPLAAAREGPCPTEQENERP
ncbi:hypothetical protein GXW78_14805 [Roseomonas terrae]|uniref:Uncharacterized protein n=1 Tax=Neoroseomonas terrae TaxID=424799 RepID=A0ABS5EIV7_9PROT|nr:hypothetical protein [Neoroseomonas terrae]MBR0650941.1 hypothetical protein [Neoroseomonas terrae]